MEWNKPFCVYRIVENGKLEAVFITDDMKKAKYWLTYIAETGDALCRTPLHPKNDSELPAYWMHKEEAGTPRADETKWKEMVEHRQCVLEFCEPGEGLE